jgi:hypothetical protein
MGEYSLGIAAAEKAIAASEEGSLVREMAEKEHSRLEALVAAMATRSAQAPVSSRPVEKTENSRSPAAGE